MLTSYTLKPSFDVVLLASVISLLSACKPTADDTAKMQPTPVATTAATSSGELAWARAALERNPHLKVLSADESHHTIQVQVKATGETLSLSPGELAALPISDFLPPATSAPPTDAVVIAADETASSAPTAVNSSSASQAKYDYQVERSQNRVRVTGPGISIESSAAAPKSNNDKAAAIDQPIICAGQRLMHVDNKTLNVDGDAIIASGGCELHITNSHITATGTAVVAQDAAVHVDNSEIKGSKNSISTTANSRLYLRHSVFSGLAHRDSQALIQDQGENSWR